MTPAARIAAAIDVLDLIDQGQAAEKALTGWARKSRFAGSKDRAAVRDHVFDALRNWRSFAALGGGRSGRQVMLGAMRARDEDPDAMFTGTAYAPPALSDAERSAGRPPNAGGEAMDLPDWIVPLWQDNLAEQADACSNALRHRAPVHLRVNLLKADTERAIKALAGADILAEPHELSETALIVTEGARRVHQSDAYKSGLVELQDAASQALVDELPLGDGQTVLDYCAGGGGKALAMAAKARVSLFAHDADPRRLRDLGPRALRAGAEIAQIESKDLAGRAPFDLVLCDAPCSGSGAWRRAPFGKWSLDQDGFEEIMKTQSEILDNAAKLVAPDGVLAYATCSVLNAENHDQIKAFMTRTVGWSLTSERQFSLLDGADGFYIAHLTRA